MNKFLTIPVVFLLVFFMSFGALAETRQTAVGSGLKTSDAVIKAGRALLTGVLILTDGANDATIILYDHASAASGTKLFQAKVAGASNFGGATFEIPLRASNGIYADITGNGASYIVYYDF